MMAEEAFLENDLVKHLNKKYGDKFDSDKIVGAYVKPPRKGRFSYTYDEDLTSLYPMIDVTLNISPKIGL